MRTERIDNVPAVTSQENGMTLKRAEEIFRRVLL